MIVNHEEYRDELLWACFRSFAQSAEISTPEGLLRCFYDSETAALAAVVSTVAEDTIASLTRCLDRASGPSEKLMALGLYLERHAEHLLEQQRFWKAVLMNPTGLDSLLAHYGRQYQALLAGVFGAGQEADDLGMALALLIDSLLAQRGPDPDVRLDRALLAFGRTVQGVTLTARR